MKDKQDTNIEDWEKELEKILGQDYSEYDAMENNSTPMEDAISYMKKVISQAVQEAKEEQFTKEELETIKGVVEAELGCLEMVMYTKGKPKIISTLKGILSKFNK